MKIGILGDVHCGAGITIGKTDPETQLNSRLLDFVDTFNTIIDNFVEKEVSTVVITGDIYDTRHPTSAQLNIFSKCLRRAVSKGITILMVVGNHDQQRTISTTTIDIYDSLQLDDIMSFPNMAVHTIKDGNKDIHLIMMPYRDRKMVDGAQTNLEAIDKIKKEIALLTSDLLGTKIVIGHFMIDKAITGETSEVFSINELVLPLDTFAGFDAIIMGHVHKSAILSKHPLTMYVGSMEKISFGEKDHTKISIILDTDNISNTEIIKTKTRNLLEMNFDYTNGDKYYKNQITDQIVADIDNFNDIYDLSDSITKLVVKVKEDDMYYVDQERIKQYILGKNVNYLSPMQITTMSSRKLRDKDITESMDSKKAMASFIKNANETETTKKKLLKFATAIIEEVEGK
jgi:DNA repair protein SbcD/Mre11